MTTDDNPAGYPFNADLEISVVDTNEAHQATKDNFLLLDIRESDELAVSAIPGATHVPMGNLPAAIAELDIEEDTQIAVLCRSGKRSLNAAVFLQQHGFKGARSVAGGILWWSDKLDPSLKKY